jgi:hypothetical protein
MEWVNDIVFGKEIGNALQRVCFNPASSRLLTGLFSSLHITRIGTLFLKKNVSLGTHFNSLSLFKLIQYADVN